MRPTEVKFYVHTALLDHLIIECYFHLPEIKLRKYMSITACRVERFPFCYLFSIVILIAKNYHCSYLILWNIAKQTCTWRLIKSLTWRWADYVKSSAGKLLQLLKYNYVATFASFLNFTLSGLSELLAIDAKNFDPVLFDFLLFFPARMHYW